MKSRVVVTIIIKKGEKFLLGRKPDNVGPYPNTWHLVGGGVDLETENIEEAVNREVKEEAGIILKKVKRLTFGEDYEPNKHGEVVHYLFLVYEGEYASGKLVAGDDIQELRWFSRQELKTLPLTQPSAKLFPELGII